MKKELILNSNLEHLNQLTPEEYTSLMNQLTDYEKSQKFASTEDLARGIIKDMPYIQMFHDASVRLYLDKISKNTSVIKHIVVIYFICSVIAAIAYLYLFNK